MRRVVVTGIGIISPLGVGSRAHWDALTAGTCAVRKIAAYDPGGWACQIGGEVPPYKIGAVVAADDAFKDSQLQSHAYSETPNFDGVRFGCNIGAGLVSAEMAELGAAMNTARTDAEINRLDLGKWGIDGMTQLTPLWLLKYLPNMLACHVTIIHQLKGPSNTITCADASSHLAIGEAFRTIQRGDADLAICGGAEYKLNPMAQIRQSLLGRLNETSNDHPDRAVRPFDADAAGAALGEGGGLLILEELERAKKRGVRIYAELVGFGASQDTYKISEPDPKGHSYAQAIRGAMREAKISAEDIDLLIPHGLGIASNDRAELAGLRGALGERLPHVSLAPIKSQTGSLAAGSGVDAATAVLALHHNRIPPAINTQKPIDGIKLNVAAKTREANIGVSLTSVFSLGGQNAALVFRKV
jgi:3-oxoacyl-[acyl-carrier-protein] synthase II